MSKKYLLAIDQGTTSCRSIIFNFAGEALFVSQEKLGQSYPQRGWVEQDLELLWQTQLKTIKACLDQVNPSEVASIGITNQRETIGLWNKAGQALTPAISWQCQRTKESLQTLQSQSKQIQQITGLPVNPYFSASKLQWLLQNNPQLKPQIDSKQVLAGTIDCWLLYKLTGCQNHFTDLSNASRTLLFDIHSGNWSEQLLALFDIPAQILPEVKPSQFHYGFTNKQILGHEIPITALIGDQQAALYGHSCFEPGSAELTCGTGGFLLVNSGASTNLTKGLLTSIAWQKEKEPITYCQEASILSVGSVIEWLCRSGLIKDTKNLDAQIEEASPGSALLVMPAITGYGSPDWDRNIKGSIVGLSAESGGPDILKASLQGIAFRIKQVACLIPNLNKLQIGGGLSLSNYFCQFLADCLQIPVSRSNNPEATAWGAAMLSHNTQNLNLNLQNLRVFKPNLDNLAQINELWNNWLRAFAEE